MTAEGGAMAKSVPTKIVSVNTQIGGTVDSRRRLKCSACDWRPERRK